MKMKNTLLIITIFITSISFAQDIKSIPCDDKLLIELNNRIESDGIESLTRFKDEK
jgi:hypothetical protein